MHVTDWFTTIVQTAGAEKPADRVIDGIDQTDWLTGRQPHSNRNGFPYWMGATLYGAKWRNFKLSLVAQTHMFDPPMPLATPRLTNLLTDPHEREPVPLPHVHSWAAFHLNKVIDDFVSSTRVEPPVPLGAPLDHVPTR
jgi:hypothetical protein